MSKVLAEKGFAVTAVEKGEDGVVKAREDRPDLAIIDTILPGIDGFETCRLIKQEAQPNPPKIVVVTGNCQAVDAKKAREAGADEYAAKTMGFEMILSAVDAVLAD